MGEGWRGVVRGGEGRRGRVGAEWRGCVSSIGAGIQVTIDLPSC